MMTTEVATETRALTGNQAAGYAAKLARVRAGFFFPIGPADEVMETVVGLIERGEMPGTEVLQLQNERSCVGAQNAACHSGIRTMFATSHDGIVWAAEHLMYAAAERIPIMVVVASRSISFPASVVGTDYYEMTMMSEYGGLMFYCESAQDILDTVIQAYKVAEDPRVSLPVIVGYDGWELSHGVMGCMLPSAEDVDRFLPPLTMPPERDPLSADCWSTYQQRRLRALGAPWVMESKYKMYLAQQSAKRLIEDVGGEYRLLTGTQHAGLLETYRHEDADVIAITMGAMSGTARTVVDLLRADGKKVGLIKIRSWRPFPDERLAELARRAKAVVVIERDQTDRVFRDVAAALCGERPQPLLLGRVVGLSGRDVSYGDIAEIIDQGYEAIRAGKVAKPFDYAQIRGLE